MGKEFHQNVLLKWGGGGEGVVNHSSVVFVVEQDMKVKVIQVPSMDHKRILKHFCTSLVAKNHVERIFCDYS